jgi:hypothetical protein
MFAFPDHLPQAEELVMSVNLTTIDTSKVVLVGCLGEFFKDSDNVTLINSINEVAASGGGNPSGGILNYGGYGFGEYKVGQQTRFFGNFYNGKFYVFLVGDHRNKEYVGRTYDGKTSFSATSYVTKSPKNLDKLGTWTQQAFEDLTKKQSKKADYKMDLPPSSDSDEED